MRAADLSITVGQWWLPVPTLVLVPIAVCAITMRDSQLLDMLNQRADAEEKWMQVLTDVGRNWQLVNIYNLRNERLAMFKRDHTRFTKLDKRAKLHRITTTWITRLSAEVLVGLAFIIGAIVFGRSQARLATPPCLSSPPLPPLSLSLCLCPRCPPPHLLHAHSP